MASVTLWRDACSINWFYNPHRETESMRIFFLLALFLYLAAQPSLACAADGITKKDTKLRISRPDDLLLDCHEISRQISTMEAIMSYTEEIQDDFRITDTGITVGKAVGSYLVGSLAGGIGIVAASFIISEAADDRAEQAAATQHTAMQRRSFLSGIYNARGCQGPLEMALIEPAVGPMEDSEITFKPRQEDRYSYND